MPTARARHSVAVADLAGLRARIRRIEGRAGGWAAAADGAADGAGRVAHLAPAVDRALPWGGLPAGALHEVIAGDADAGAATRFAAALLRRFADGGGRPVLWCAAGPPFDAGDPYPPGLAAAGLDPARLIQVRAPRPADALWAMEEALHTPALAAVVVEIAAVSLTATRRLQLAAEASGVTALLLRPRAGSAAGGTSAALTRWRVTAEPGSGSGAAGMGSRRLRAALVRCRGGAPDAWLMEWQDATGDFAVAAPVRDRPAMPSPARAAG